jgi:hypothetical protein
MVFIKRVENFICQHCGALVNGNGFTNHCPHCLWSRHVDNEPGDRAASCRGMMRPAALIGSSPNYRILYSCTACGIERLNNAQPEDDPDALVLLANHPHAPQGDIINMETGEDFDPLAEEHSYPESDKGAKEGPYRRD